MEYYHYLLVLGAGLVAGFINVIAGGGSLLTLPVLIFMGIPASVANGTNRVGIFLQNVFAVKGFASKGLPVTVFSVWLSVSALIGATVGAMIAVDMRDATFNRILAVVMILVIIATMMGKNNVNTIEGEQMSMGRKVLSVILFLFVGIYGGFIQAGIGFFIMASLSAVHKMPLNKVNSIKVFVALIYTISALGVFIWNDQINWKLGLTLAAGTSTGGWVASRWSANKGDKVIRIFLVIAVSVMAIKLWFFG